MQQCRCCSFGMKKGFQTSSEDETSDVYLFCWVGLWWGLFLADQWAVASWFIERKMKLQRKLRSGHCLAPLQRLKGFFLITISIPSSISMVFK